MGTHKEKGESIKMDLIHPRAGYTLDNLLLLKHHFQVRRQQ